MKLVRKTLNNNRRNSKLSISVLLLLLFLFCWQGVAFGLDSTNMTDLEMAKYLVGQGSLYDVENVLTYSSVEEVMAALKKVDKYAQYYTEEELKYTSDSNHGSKFGIGVRIQEQDGNLVIVGFIEGKPAEKSGLAIGDVLLKVAGADLKDKPVEAVSYYIEQNMADEIPVVILRDGKEMTFYVAPTEVEIDSVAYGMIEDKIGYIQIVQFTARTPQEFEHAVTELKKQGMQCFMLDLRSCPGGVLDGVVAVSGYLIPESPFVFIQEKNGREYYYRSHGQVIDMPFVVLVNENTASAAELLSGSIQDVGNSVIIGTKTYGKGLVQGIYPLPSGAGIKLTVSKYFTRNYQDIDAQKGITPDIVENSVERQNEIALNILRKHAQYGNEIRLTLGSSVMKTASGEYQLDYPVYTKDDRAMLPLRQMVEALGGTVYSVEDTIYVLANGKQIEINSGTGDILFRGNIIELPVEFPNGVTTVSVRLFTELLGYDVTFYDYNDSIVIQ